MRLAAGGALVTVKHRAMKPVNKVKIVPVVNLIKMCLNYTYSKVYIGKHLSDTFPIQNYLKQRRFFVTIAFQLCFVLYH
jgi:hypothetical protein